VGSYKDPGVKASDNADGDITAKVTTSGGVNVGKAGNYTIYYNVSDESSNAAETKSRIVRVIEKQDGPDTTRPEITLVGKSFDTVKVGATWKEPGYKVWDNRDTVGLGAAVKVTITSSGGAVVPAVTTTAETYFTLTYTVKDTAGNSSTPKQRIVVVNNIGTTDNIKPVIKLEGAARCSVMQGTPYVDRGATATDSVPGNPTRINLSANITRVVKDSLGAVVQFDLFYKTVGLFTITYSVSDEAKNSASVSRYVLVKDSAGISPDSMFKKYGVPLTAALPSINPGRYADTPFVVDGQKAVVPNIKSIRELTIAWDLQNNNVNQFSISLWSGTYMNFTVNGNPYKLTQTFGSTTPKFSISGSGISKLDGEYYIKADAKQCVWVRTDGSFAIIFKSK
jgi:hypothetical protein